MKQNFKCQGKYSMGEWINPCYNLNQSDIIDASYEER